MTVLANLVSRLEDAVRRAAAERYAEQREAFRPFDTLVEPDEAMRADTVSLVQRAAANQKRIYLLVNNKAEGSAPLTLRELAAIYRCDLSLLVSDYECELLTTDFAMPASILTLIAFFGSKDSR